MTKCDFHSDCEAQYDFRTTQGFWAFGCSLAWKEHRASPTLGTGDATKLKKLKAGIDIPGLLEAIPELAGLRDEGVDQILFSAAFALISEISNDTPEGILQALWENFNPETREFLNELNERVR